MRSSPSVGDGPVGADPCAAPAEHPGPAATLYDAGGWIDPGLSVVENRTGAPEPVLTGPRWDAPLSSDERTRAARDWREYRRSLDGITDSTIRAKEHSAFLAGWSSRHARQ